MHKLPFTKLQGTGNDFVLIDARGGRFPKPTAQLARKLCDRRFGVGCDQLLWLTLPPKREPGLDARLLIFNADGSRAEMCGNGLRAVGRYLNKMYLKRSSFKIDTDLGRSVIEATKSGFRVSLGVPFIGTLVVPLKQGPCHMATVRIGNPHAVLWVKNVNEAPVDSLGPEIESHPLFPGGVNVGFLEQKSLSYLRVRVWERGAGATLACGSGACAAAVVAISCGKAKSPVRVELPGGTLLVSWKGSGHEIFLEGPAEIVFSGEF